MHRSWTSVGVWFGCVCLALLLCCLPSSGRASGNVDVRYLVPGKKVIPVFCRIGHWAITDIKLPDLVVTNGHDSPLTVIRAEATGMVAGVEVVRLCMSGAPLQDAVATTAKPFNTQALPLPAVYLSMGNVLLPEGALAESNVVAAGQSVLLPLSKIAFLHHVGHAPLDAMDIALTVESGGAQSQVVFPVQLTPYVAKGNSIFPLRGDLHMAFLPLSYIHHRASFSQEFAMDVVAANQAGATSFTEISRPDPQRLSDYGVWGRDVLAMGDGTVVETGERFPEQAMSEPARFENQEYVSGVLKELVPKIGWTNAVAGNYVIINHGNGEFSAYCHLQEGSLQVKPGDRVQQGKIIARVGNTGNSGAPHLHFQLMDSQDFFTANGLPMQFANVPAQVMIAEFPVQANTLSFSDNLFVSVP